MKLKKHQYQEKCYSNLMNVVNNAYISEIGHKKRSQNGIDYGNLFPGMKQRNVFKEHSSICDFQVINWCIKTSIHMLKVFLFFKMYY